MGKNDPQSSSLTEKLKQSRFYKFLEKKIDWKTERQVFSIAKVLTYILIVMTEVLLFVEVFSQRKLPIEGSAFPQRLAALIIASGILTIANAVRLFLAKSLPMKIGCIVLEMVSSVAMIAVTGSNYLIFLYIIILSGYYLTSRNPVYKLLVFIFSIPVYITSYSLAMGLWRGSTDLPYAVVISDSVWALVALVAHFFLMNFALSFYRQYLKLDKALTELSESRSELEKAYDSLAEATALEERQRIAKEIHDTAGHSITTVIMQTEAAKLVIDKNPDDAKVKLIAANLQAKNALEQLRESVHVLSGNTAKGTLKAELTKVIEESALCTGISIRYEIEDVTVSAAKDRMLCNALKECISNGLRHGGATAFWVELKPEFGQVKLLVSDNGCGVDVGKLKKGFGLTAMLESAERLGGSLQLTSEEEDGLEVVVRLPIDG